MIESSVNQSGSLSTLRNGWMFDTQTEGVSFRLVGRGGVEEDSGVMRDRRGVVVGKGAGLGLQRFGAAPVVTEHSSVILLYLLICWNGAASRHDEINTPNPSPPHPPSLSLSLCVKDSLSLISPCLPIQTRSCALSGSARHRYQYTQTRPQVKSAFTS